MERTSANENRRSPARLQCTFAEYVTTYVNGRPVTSLGEHLRQHRLDQRHRQRNLHQHLYHELRQLRRTTGQIGGQNYHNNSTQIGKYRYSNGNIGDTNYDSTGCRIGIGNTYYTNSRYSSRW